MRAFAVGLLGIGVITAPPCAADPLPPGPSMSDLPALTAPLKPQLKSTENHGITVETNADEGEDLAGMPGPPRGNSPFRIGLMGPTTGVRTGTGSAGVQIGFTAMSGGLENPEGQAPPTPPPGEEAPAIVPPAPPGL